MKKLLSALLAVSIVFGGALPSAVNKQDHVISASAAEEYTDGTYGVLTYKNYGDYIEISDCDESAEKIVIPSEINGVPVTNIGNWAFGSCDSLTSVTIPGSVTSIGAYAFIFCSSLTSVTIPGSVMSIGGNAFNRTPWLMEKQGENPFVIVNGILIDGQTCEGDVVVPDNVKSIGDYAFSECENLTSVTIPEGVAYIGESAFSRCNNLTSVIIPKSITRIEEYTFWGCSSLTSVTIPDSITSIGDDAFSDCSSLISVTLPDSVVSIGYSAFEYCYGLTSITIPDSVTEIKARAFS